MSIRIDTVVIGVDFSVSSLDTVHWVARHFAPDARLVLVHSVEASQAPGFYSDFLPPLDDLVEDGRKRAEERLAQLDGELAATSVRREVRIGRAADEVVAVARDSGADLIVVGAHGDRQGLFGGLGNTAEQLLRCSKVPVLVARSVREAVPSRILIPLDDSAMTPLVLAWARALVDRFGAEVVGLHVISPALRGHLRLLSSEAKTEEVQRRALERAEEWLAARLVEAGFDESAVSVRAAFGHPGYEVLAAAQRYGVDLIVMGTRGAGAVRRALIGSVACSVLRGASCPVLAVPGRWQEADERPDADD